MKDIKKWLVFIILLALNPPALFLSSCKHEPDAFVNLDTVCFETQVLPIMQTSCGMSGCHSSGSAQGGFVSINYSSIMNAVEPGDVSKSTLYEVITNINSIESMMPPDRPLTKEQRTVIHIWIEQGAKNTQCTVNPIDTTNYGEIITNPDTLCFTQDILPLLQSSCASTGCHDAISHQEDYIFTSYTSLMSDPELIVPYNPNDSKVYEVITTTDSEDRMPPSPYSPLSDNQKEMFRRWIAEGAINSDCPQFACDTLDPILFTEQIYPLIDRSCIACHNTNNASGGVMLDGYTKILYFAEHLRTGTPIIVGAIRQLEGFTPMPPYGTLDECSIRKIELWIEQGLLDN